MRLSFEAEAYEELPLDNNLVYSTTGKGKKKVTTSTNIDPAEDNGFLTSLDIPLSRRVTMSGFYNRSLRDRDDVGGFLVYVSAEGAAAAAGSPVYKTQQGDAATSPLCRLAGRRTRPFMRRYSTAWPYSSLA